MKETVRVEEHTGLFNEQALSLERLLNKLQYPEPIEKAVKEKLSKPGITEIANIAYSAETFDYPLCKRMPLTRLAVVTWLLQRKYREYKAIGVADEIIFETFSDVTLRTTLYYQKTKRVGISKEDVIWFRHKDNYILSQFDAYIMNLEHQIESLETRLDNLTDVDDVLKDVLESQEEAC